MDVSLASGVVPLRAALSLPSSSLVALRALFSRFPDVWRSFGAGYLPDALFPEFLSFAFVTLIPGSRCLHSPQCTCQIVPNSGSS